MPGEPYLQPLSSPQVMGSGLPQLFINGAPGHKRRFGLLAGGELVWCWQEESYFCLPAGAAEGMGFFEGCFALISSDAGAVNYMTQGDSRRNVRKIGGCWFPPATPPWFLKVFLWVLLGTWFGEKWVLGLFVCGNSTEVGMQSPLSSVSPVGKLRQQTVVLCGCMPSLWSASPAPCFSSLKERTQAAGAEGN